MQQTSVCSHLSAKHSGFSLLEAIVALVIFSAVGVVLFTWINQSVNQVADIDDLLAEARIEERAFVELMTINLFEHSSGAFTLEDGWQVTWQSEMKTPLRRNSPLYGGESGSHTIQLFQVEAQLQPLPLAATTATDLSHLNATRPPRTLQFTRLMTSR